MRSRRRPSQVRGQGGSCGPPAAAAPGLPRGSELTCSGGSGAMTGQVGAQPHRYRPGSSSDIRCCPRWSRLTAPGYRAGWWSIWVLVLLPGRRLGIRQAGLFQRARSLRLCGFSRHRCVARATAGKPSTPGRSGSRRTTPPGDPTRGAATRWWRRWPGRGARASPRSSRGCLR